MVKRFPMWVISVSVRCATGPDTSAPRSRAKILKHGWLLCFLSSDSSSFLRRIMSGRWSERESQATFKAKPFPVEGCSYAGAAWLKSRSALRTTSTTDALSRASFHKHWDGGAQLSSPILLQIGAARGTMCSARSQAINEKLGIVKTVDETAKTCFLMSVWIYLDLDLST